MKVALCAICTGKYIQFAQQFLDGAKRYFLSSHTVVPILFSNSEVPGLNATWIYADHEPWPGPTLHRFRTMLLAEQQLSDVDYAFSIDIDMRFVGDVGDEVLGDLVATLHPGYAGKPRQRFPYETRPESLAFIPREFGTRYFCGAFWGARGGGFLSHVRQMANIISTDESRGIIPRWHDESALNAYLAQNPPTTILQPNYCCPEKWQMKNRKILALDKSHAALRT